MSQYRLRNIGDEFFKLFVLEIKINNMYELVDKDKFTYCNFIELDVFNTNENNNCKTKLVEYKF